MSQLGEGGGWTGVMHVLPLALECLPAILLRQSLVFHGTHCCFLLLVLPGAAGNKALLLWPR